MSLLCPQQSQGATPTGTKKNPLNSKKLQDGPWNESLFHQACGVGVDALLIKAMRVQSLDNLNTPNNKCYISILK